MAIARYALFKAQIVAIILDCGIDISAAQAPKIAVRKPDGTEVEWSAAVNSATSLIYTTEAGDLDQVGEYRLQAVPDLPTGYARGATVGLTVKDNFQA